MSGCHEMRLACEAEPLFALITAVERYPEFVPGFLSVRVVARSASSLEVAQRVRIGPLPLAFTSRALLEPPRRVRVVSDAPLFRHFVMEWTLTPGDDGCLVRLCIKVEMRVPALQRVVDAAAGTMARQVAEAFARRAREALD